MEKLKKFFFSLNIKNILILLCIFNLFDAILTLFWIEYGIAEESNPIMEYALSQGVAYFFVMKIALVSAGCILLYRLREFLMARVISVLSLMIYWVVLGYHFVGFYMSTS